MAVHLTDSDPSRLVKLYPWSNQYPQIPLVLYIVRPGNENGLGMIVFRRR